MWAPLSASSLTLTLFFFLFPLNYGPLTVTHSEPFDAYIWFQVSDRDALVRVRNPEGQFGNVAVGHWSDSWYTNESIPVEPYLFYADFDLRISEVAYGEGEWLRVAVVAECWDGVDESRRWYTELDVWDSPNTYPGETGVLYAGEDVVEFKVDQMEIGRWYHYSFEFTEWILEAWGHRALGWEVRGVYIVVELGMAPTEATIAVRNLNLQIGPRHLSKGVVLARS